jgi:NTE family protein
VRVLSGVSGGALMAALWAYHAGDFGEFDQAAVVLLRHGLHWDIVRHAARPGAVSRSLLGFAATLARPGRPHPLRTTTRTDALAAALRERAFGDKTMNEANTHTEVVLTTTDLITGSAVRFGSAVSSSSRLGRILDPWTVADVVAASAAYPALLPAVERNVRVGEPDQPREQVVLLADGGLYDNLGLSVLEPGRFPAHTEHAYDLNYLISCDAGRGPLAPKAPHLWPWRMKRAAEILHERAQNQGRRRIHEWQQSGAVTGFTMAYLGMRDDRLPVTASDLVPRERVATYPTNFAAMSQTDLDALAGRGEQLIRTLLPYYCPELLTDRGRSHLPGENRHRSGS